MGMPVSRTAGLLRTLGDETRLQLLVLLQRREFCVCELVDLFPISQPAVSGHLRRLKDAGLVRDDRRGMWVYYRACETVPTVVQGVLAEVELPPGLLALLGTPAPAARCDEAPTCRTPDAPPQRTVVSVSIQHPRGRPSPVKDTAERARARL